MQERSGYNVITCNVNKMNSVVKIDALTEFLQHRAADVAILQEVVTTDLEQVPGFDVFTNIDAETRTGTAVMVTNGIDTDDIKTLTDGRGIAIKIAGTYFVSIYAPSGTEKKRARSQFFNEDICALLPRNNSNVVLGGDFNCVSAPEDQVPAPNLCMELQELLRKLNLRDSWRLLYPNTTEFTYFHNRGRSRLDRICETRELATSVSRVEGCPVIFSDHCAYICKLQLPTNKLSGGRSAWKLNTEHPSDAKLQQEIALTLEESLQTRQQYPTTTQWWVACGKPQIRKTLIRHSAEKAFCRNSTADFHTQCLKDALNCPPDDDLLLTRVRGIKARLLNIRRQQMKGVVVRSQTHGATEDEPATLHHLHTERERAQNRTVRELSDAAGRKITTRRDMMHHVEEHFSELFKGEEPDDAETAKILQGMRRRLNDTDRALLTEAVSEEEVKAVLKTCANGKAPGATDYRQNSTPQSRCNNN
ncbi:uncharacterized protein LOC126456905 [Schistocerca serialis cubense]|uniref:uncharacterized protein LOC126456905 n=1 Tax=Schistocerca serialis cubense TaxID=2023355 RepID=UPI00214F3E16|nr:uncharacterized protein LOC126456905 [Schistocerca serialis cubense]